jgi:hypothetical protein
MRAAITTAALLSLAACGGGSGSSAAGGPNPISGPTAAPRSASAVTISGTIVGSGPYVHAHGRRPQGLRSARALTFQMIQVDGTLYTADAAAYTVHNTGSIAAPSNSVYAASVHFSNVPAGNNLWGLLTFTGVAADGSRIALGELGGLISVGGSSANTATFTASTTLQLQVFATLLRSGLITPYDIDNNFNLASTISTIISNSGVAPNANTGVFDAGGLQQIYNAAAPSFQRNATISTSPNTAGSVVLVRDYTKPAELNLESNLETFLGDIGIPVLGTQNAGSFVLLVSGVLGFDQNCGGFSLNPGLLRTAGTTVTPVPSLVLSCSVPNPTGTVSVRNVYGGNLMIGATNDPYDPSQSWSLPFAGGWLANPGFAAAGAPAPLSVPVASTELALQVNDPYGVAFPLAAAPFAVFPTFGTGPLSGTELTTATRSPIDQFRYVQGPFSGSASTVTIDTFNPWNVAAANLSLCTEPIPLSVQMVLPACYAVNAAQPFAITRTFTDDGTNLSYYNWALGGAGGSGGTIVPDGSGSTYDVTPAGPGIVTLTTTTPTALFGRSQIEIFNELPLGTIWSVTVTTSVNHASHTNSGANTTCSCGGTAAIVEIDDLGSLKNIEQITLSVDPSNTPFTVGPIYGDPTGTSVVHGRHRVPASHGRAGVKPARG